MIHPLFVHLPIGIILLAVCFEWMVHKERTSFLRASLPLIWRLGAIAAILSCISGWFMRNSGEYAGSTVEYHQWAGIATAAMATIACLINNRFWWSMITAVVLIMTGHLGGTLTHGEGYLFQTDKSVASVAIADIGQAGVYTDLIAPVFAQKCISCHGSTKQKGNLRLDAPEYITLGGKHGNLLVGISGSELLKHLQLPLDDDRHMPPAAKPQLTGAELQLIEWWVAQGADFQKKVSELTPSAPIKTLLANWGNSGAKIQAANTGLPDTVVQMAPPESIKKLQKAGLTVVQMAQGSPWLSVSYVNQYTPDDSLFALLELVAPQVIQLNLSDVTIPEGAWLHLTRLPCLTRIHLNGSSIKDIDLHHFSNHRFLRHINLSHTGVTVAATGYLAKIRGLQQVFLYQTKITAAEWPAIFSALPGVTIDTGNYVVPTLATDTTMLKEEKKY